MGDNNENTLHTQGSAESDSIFQMKGPYQKTKQHSGIVKDKNNTDFETTMAEGVLNQYSQTKRSPTNNHSGKANKTKQQKLSNYFG